MVGLGEVCSHVGALLHVDADADAVTDELCVWNKPKKKLWFGCKICLGKINQLKKQG